MLICCVLTTIVLPINEKNTIQSKMSFRGATPNAKAFASSFYLKLNAVLLRLGALLIVIGRYIIMWKIIKMKTTIHIP